MILCKHQPAAPLAALLLSCSPAAGLAASGGEISVLEMRVQDRNGNGVKSKLFEVTRDGSLLSIDITDDKGIFARTFKCPRWHKVVAKPVAGPYSDSPHTRCARNVVLTVSVVKRHPEASVRIIVPFGAGGTADAAARSLAQRLMETWKQNVIVENRPGAGGNIGTKLAAEAAPDGYTLLMVPSQIFTIYPQLQSKLPYNPQTDFSPVTMVASVPMVLVAPRSAPANSVKDVVDKAKANPGKINFGFAGIRSESHVAMAQFGPSTGTRIQLIPYKAQGDAMQSLLGGQVDFAINPLPAVLPDIREGKLKALAIAGPSRSEALPGVPTMVEAGVAGYDAGVWLGLFAPDGTPAQLVRKMQSDIASTVKDPSVARMFASRGLDAVGSSTPGEFAALIKQDMSSWARRIRAAGLKKE